MRTQMIVATKTISIDVDAYERLKRARRHSTESFSQVIKRAHWEAPASTAAGLLEALESAPVPSKSALARLEQAQREDLPPDDPWTG